MESEYDLVTSLMEAILNKGKSTIGTRATTGSGIASKTHQLIINIEMAKTKFGFDANENGFRKKTSKKNRIPVMSSSLFLLNSNHFFICFIERTNVVKKISKKLFNIRIHLIEVNIQILNHLHNSFVEKHLQGLFHLKNNILQYSKVDFIIFI
jgi:hypothetical protein